MVTVSPTCNLGYPPLLTSLRIKENALHFNVVGRKAMKAKQLHANIEKALLDMQKVIEAAQPAKKDTPKL